MNTLLARYHNLPSHQRTAVLIVIGLILYLILANLIGSGKDVNNDTIALTSDKPLSELVRIEEMTATEKPIFLSLYGFTEANRQVGLRAQVEGMVETIEATEGSAVAAGDVIVKIEERDRAARVAQAKALLTQREVEYEAARKLRKTGAESKVRLVKTKADLEAARAELKAAEVAYQNTKIYAPFAGTVEEINAEVGVLVGDMASMMGGANADVVLVEYDPLVVHGQIPQQKRAYLKKDTTAKVRLVNGETAEGTIRFIGSVTDPNTRTFRVEVELPNPEGNIPVGVSAELKLPAGTENAYLVSPSALSLDDVGNIGVKVVDDENIVRFQIVQLLEDSADGIWVTGLPKTIRLITLGQNFVSDGQPITDEPPQEG